MKKLVMLVGLVMFMLVGYAQTNTDTVYFTKIVDDMNGSISYPVNRAFIVANDAMTTGFKVEYTFFSDQHHLAIKATNIGNCHEKDELIILLESGDKIILKSWNKFNCEGLSYFKLDFINLKILSLSPIAKIRLTNGRSYESYTDVPKTKDITYFMDCIKFIHNNFN